MLFTTVHTIQLVQTANAIACTNSLVCHTCRLITLKCFFLVTLLCGLCLCSQWPTAANRWECVFVWMKGEVEHIETPYITNRWNISIDSDGCLSRHDVCLHHQRMDGRSARAAYQTAMCVCVTMKPPATKFNLIESVEQELVTFAPSSGARLCSR